MITIALAIIILLNLLYYIVILDVILSWLALAWIKRPKFIGTILDPMYKVVKDTIPTKIWPFELTPIILLIWFLFLIWIVELLVPWVSEEMSRLRSN